MIPKEYLGRYHYVNPSENSNKFWHIVLDMSTQEYVCTWGRIGNNAPPPVIYDEKKAWTKIREKIKKGYFKQTGYMETTGTQSVHFIKTLCEG